MSTISYDKIDEKICDGKAITKKEWEYYRKNTLKSEIKKLKQKLKLRKN